MKDVLLKDFFNTHRRLHVLTLDERYGDFSPSALSTRRQHPAFVDLPVLQT